MSHTLESVVEQLGEEAQVGAGAVVVMRESKHVLVAHTTENGFEVTPAGLEILEGTALTDDGNTVILAKKPEAPMNVKKPHAPAKPTTADLDDALAA
jgi:hypothetical protein